MPVFSNSLKKRFLRNIPATGISGRMMPLFRPTGDALSGSYFFA
jgi:hypothetical protein